MNRIIGALAAAFVSSFVLAVVSSATSQPQPLPDATTVTRGAVNVDPAQTLRGKHFIDQLSVIVDAGPAFSSACVAFPALGICDPTRNGLQCVTGAGWYACQADGGWGQIGNNGASGAVSNIFTDSPLSTSGGQTPTLSCAIASGSQAGCLSSADWSTFNTKLHSASAAAPLVSDGGTITCPFASSVDGGCISASDWAYFDAKVDSISTTAPIRSSGGLTPMMSCDVASSSQPGCLSQTDWISFNARLPSVSASSPLLSDGGTVSVDKIGALQIGTIQADAGLITGVFSAGIVDAGLVGSVGGFFQSTPLALGQMANSSVESTIQYASGIGSAEHHVFVQGQTNPDGGAFYEFYGDAGTRRQLPFSDETLMWTGDGINPVPSKVIAKTGTGTFVSGEAPISLTDAFASAPNCWCNDRNGNAAGVVRPCGYAETQSSGDFLVFVGNGNDQFRWTCLGTPRPISLFEFGLTDGTGMTTACSGTPLASTIGTPVHFSRALSVYCAKGNEIDHINNGDLVLIGPNIPRVMPGGDGTGPMGVSIWDTRRNYVWPSQQFDNPLWMSSANGVANPVVTPNVAIAPDGTLTADQIDFPATSLLGGTYSFKYQQTCPSDFDVRLIYARMPVLSDGGTQTGAFEIANGSFNTFSKYTCNPSSDYWTRCAEYDTTGGDNGTNYVFGSLVTHPAQSIYFWQADCVQNSNQASSPYPPPIPTVDAGATMPPEIAEVTLITPMVSDLRMQMQFASEDGLGAEGGTLASLNGHNGVAWFLARRASNKLQCETNNGTAVTTSQSTAAISAGATLACTHDGNQSTSACIDSSCVAATIDAGVASEVLLTIGSNWDGFAYSGFANGVIKGLSGGGSSSKTIALFGDSIVEAVTAGIGHEPQDIIHRQFGNAVAIQNLGHSGDVSSQCRAKWEAQLPFVIDAGTGPRTYWMVQCGTNGLSDAGGTLADLTAMVAEGVDAGINVLWSTITPSNNSTVAIPNFNIMIKAVASDAGVKVANTFSALEYPPDSGLLNPLYDYGDNVHLNDAGVYVETQVWISAGPW